LDKKPLKNTTFGPEYELEVKLIGHRVLLLLVGFTSGFNMNSWPWMDGNWLLDSFVYLTNGT